MQTIQEWHNRFTVQASWSQDIVNYVIEKYRINSDSSILEVGCGTGSMFGNFPNSLKITGMDIDFDRVKYANENKKNDSFYVGDANMNAIANNSFDLVFCHYLLLWVSTPLLVLQEMIRVAKMGGAIAILAEPNYESRIDRPAEFIPIGKAQTLSLINQGANPSVGSELQTLFSGLNLEDIEIKKYQQMDSDRPMAEWKSEWEILEFDLKQTHSPTNIHELKKSHFESILNKSRKSIIPMYYGIGKKGEQNED